MPTLRIGQESFHVVDLGRGPPVLLVHGFPLSHAMWAGQLKTLSARHRVIAPDLRGFGGSVVTDGTVTMERHADDLAAILDALGLTEAVTYVGFSMGGYAGWPFLARHGGRVRALIACDTKADADSPEAAAGRRTLADRVIAEGSTVAADAMLPRLLAPGRAERTPALAASLHAMMSRSDPRGVAAALRGMAVRRDHRASLASIRVPTLAIVGAHDALTTPADMRGVADGIPGARYLEIPGSGHMSPMEAPDAVTAALLDFLDGSASAGRAAR